MRFIAVAEIADIFIVRNVGFGDQAAAGIGAIEDQAPQFDNLVHFRQVDAGRARRLPDKPDGIKADRAPAGGGILQQHIDAFQQHRRLTEVNVDLVFAEGGPDIHALLVRFYIGREQRQGARAHHIMVIGLRIGFDKVVLVLFLAFQVALEPHAGAGNMVYHAVEHQIKMLVQRPDIRPIAQFRVNAPVIDHAETIVGCPRKHRQQVNIANQPLQPAIGKLFQHHQRFLFLLVQAVAVGD